MKVAPTIKSELPTWADPVPYQIKKIAVRDACFAVRDAKKKTKKGEKSLVKFRSRKDRVQSIFVPSTAIKAKGVYHKILGELRLSQDLPEKIKDSRLILHRGQYFLCVSTETSVVATENQSGSRQGAKAHCVTQLHSFCGIAPSLPHPSRTLRLCVATFVH